MHLHPCRESRSMGIAVRGRFVRAVADDEFDMFQTGAVWTAVLRGRDLDDVDESGAAVAGSDLYRRRELERRDRPAADIGLDEQAEIPGIVMGRSASTRTEYSSIDPVR